MKYIVDGVVKNIIRETKGKNGKFIYRVDSFDSIETYEQIAQKLTSKFSSTNVELLIQLSFERYELFKTQTQNQLHLTSMAVNGWIAESPLTELRNRIPDSGKKMIIVLMGTEVVEDKGGLHDFYQIDLGTIENELNGKYNKMFDKGGAWNSDDEIIVDKLCNALFEYVPVDLETLSRFSDDLGTIETADDFIVAFFSNLSRFGLLNQQYDIPTKQMILNDKHKVIFKFNFNFTYRKLDLASTKSKFEGFKKKIEKFEKDHKEFEYYVNKLEDSGLDYNDIKRIVEEYVVGENIEHNRSKLKNIDFYFIFTLLGIKLEREDPIKKDKTIRLNGSPQTVFATAILYELSNCNTQFSEFRFTFKSIALVDEKFERNDNEYDEFEANGSSLLRTFENFCRATNGAIKYVSNCNWSTNVNEDYKISIYPDNIFEIGAAATQINQKLVTSVGAGKIKNKIEFVVSLIKENGVAITPVHKYEWTFSNAEGWRYDFIELAYMKENLNIEGTAFLPISTIDKPRMMESVFSETEFYDAYEEVNMSHTNVMIELAASFNSEEQWKSEYLLLGESFSRFLCAYYEKGFYECKDEINSFFSIYSQLGRKIINSSFTEQQDWLVRAFLSLFSIQEDIQFLHTSEDSTSVLIPPWHPATLQKIIHKETFIMDGITEWWTNNSQTNNMSLTKITKMISELDNQSKITLGIDTYPMKNKRYMSLKSNFGDFFYYGDLNQGSYGNIRAKDIVKKEAVFDESFSDKEYNTLDANATLILDAIVAYTGAFLQRKYELILTFINPSDLQPIVAAIHKYIEENKSDDRLKIILYLVVSPENRGGKTYLLYWLNTFFSDDDNVSVEVYIKQWGKGDTNQLELSNIRELIPSSSDIIFAMDLLKTDTVEMQSLAHKQVNKITDCKFPIVYVPAPHSQSSAKRKIEITQNQFELACLHADIAYHLNHLQEQGSHALVTKTVEIDGSGRDFIKNLHEKSYWVVCVDAGIDGGLLKGHKSEDYSIIGYSTGKGSNGEKNITITAKKQILVQIQKIMKMRLRKLFNCDDALAEEISVEAMNQASKMDGVSIFKAINFKDSNINEFLGYMLALQYCKTNKQTGAFSTIIHLDSYKHWFNGTIKDTKMRPDFLFVNVFLEDEKIRLEMDIMESKLSSISTAEIHLEKAFRQVSEGELALSALFAPESTNTSIKRKYWYAQLFRAISFAQITHCDNTNEFANLAKNLNKILDGDFEVVWNKSILGFWKDSREKSINIVDDEGIKIHNIPQNEIYKLLLNNSDRDIEYIPTEIEECSLIEKIGSEVEITPQKQQENQELVFEDVASKSIASTTTDISTETELSIDQQTLPDELNDNSPTSKPTNKSYDKTELEKISVLLGKTKRTRESISWEFGSKKLSNRHVLITGSSGQGKTYLVQTMLLELLNNGISSIIFDYTEGFRSDMLEPEFVEQAGSYLKEHIVYFSGLPINPFRRHEIEVAGRTMQEHISDVANRLADILKNVYGFGDQQYAAIYTACKNGMEKHGDSMNMRKFAEELDEINTTYSKSVLSKITPFVDVVKFETDANFSWSNFMLEKQVFVFQLTNFSKEMQVIMTELMLWDAWFYNRIHGKKDKPFVVVLDEAQNLSHKEGSPTQKILTEGRKFGWSAWFATQFLKGQLVDSEINRLQQAALRIYFKPSDNDVENTAKMIGNKGDYLSLLRNLQRGSCIVSTSLGVPKEIKVSTFLERLEDEAEH